MGLLILVVVGVSSVMRDTFLRHSLYPAPSLPVPSPPLPLVEVTLDTTNGDRISAWAYDAKSSNQGASRVSVLVLHGNGENLATLELSGTLLKLRQLGVSFLAIDYPGYGRSAGKASEKANIAAATAGLEWLSLKTPGDHLVIWGWSLGAGVGVQAAARAERIHGLITLSPWSSLEAVATEHFPRWLIRWALTESYDSVAAAESVSCPALVAHGGQDLIIPAHQGKRLAEAFPNLYRWIEIPGAGHNDLLAAGALWQEMADFFNHLQESPPRGRPL